mgnify:CR=1 FL=1
MIKFSKEKVLLLHRLIAEETGGSIGVRYETLLESALENVFSGFGGQEFYPTREEKGARLGYALISNHAFVDGNKRISLNIIVTNCPTCWNHNSTTIDRHWNRTSRFINDNCRRTHRNDVVGRNN